MLIQVAGLHPFSYGRVSLAYKIRTTTYLNIWGRTHPVIFFQVLQKV